jgi:AcrR family transcriptional regulator
MLLPMTSLVSRQKVVSAAKRVFSRDEDATMEDVAAAAGVSLRTLYRMFASRDELLQTIDWQPPASARERLLEEAFELLGKQSLAQLSMDELAVAAGVSRATLYRFFPGKPALFKALIRAFSPWESVADVLESAADRRPEQMIPSIGNALANALEGRTGILLRMVFEMVRGEPDAREGVRRSMTRGLPDLIQYLGDEMAAGRLRRMHPIIAFQLLAGPIFVHLATRPLAAMLGFKAPLREVVQEIVHAWLRAMAPEKRAESGRRR